MFNNTIILYIQCIFKLLSYTSIFHCCVLNNFYLQTYHKYCAEKSLQTIFVAFSLLPLGTKIKKVLYWYRWQLFHKCILLVIEKNAFCLFKRNTKHAVFRYFIVVFYLLCLIKKSILIYTGFFTVYQSLKINQEFLRMKF